MATVFDTSLDLARLGIDHALTEMAKTYPWEATAELDEIGLIVTLTYKPLLFGMVPTPPDELGAALFVKWLPRRWQMRRVVREALSTIPQYLKFKAECAVRRAQESNSG